LQVSYNEKLAECQNFATSGHTAHVPKATSGHTAHVPKVLQAMKAGATRSMVALQTML
jgi:hypothetical protein